MNWNIFKRQEKPVAKPEAVMIDRAWAKEMCRRVEYTPDAHVFNRTLYQLYFAYGIDKKGFHLHDRLIAPFCMNNGPLADVFTEGSFTMVKKKLGWASYPIVTDLKLWNTPQHKIRGQLYAIRPEIIPELDKIYLNTVEFERQRITVQMPFHQLVWSRKQGHLKLIKADHHHYTAWAYLAPADHWRDQIDCGYLFGNVKVTDPNNHSQFSQYYNFTHDECKNE